MKKLIGGCFTTLGVIFALIIVLAFGCSRAAHNSSKTDEKTTATQTEASKDEGESKDEKKAAEEADASKKKEEEKKEDKKDETKAEEKQEEEASAEESSDAAEGNTEDSSSDNDSGLPADYIRPEFQEFIDAYLAFYREYADYMARYNEDPTNTELMLGLADLIDREAEMAKTMDNWEAEDMTAAESALFLEAQAEAVRLTASAL